MNHALYSPPVVIFLAVLGLSFLVACLDFARRRANAVQVVAAVQASQAVAQRFNEPPKVAPVEVPPMSVEEPKRRTPIDRLARLHAPVPTARGTLGFGTFQPLPMPKPRVPSSPTKIMPTISWWQEAQSR
jgi:hypothetical protein